MSFLDTLKDKARAVIGPDELYGGDDYYDEGYEGDDYAADAPRSGRRSGDNNHVLNNASRPEPESVSVYTRSGRPVSGSQTPVAARPQAGYGSDAPVSGYAARSYATPSTSSAASSPASIDLNAPAAASATVSSQLPPYVLKPVSYDDVQTVVRRVRTNQPVVLVFRNTNIDIAKRILDFCFGLSFGLNGEVKELGDRVFVVLPAGADLSKSDIEKLVADGDLVK